MCLLLLSKRSFQIISNFFLKLKLDNQKYINFSFNTRKKRVAPTFLDLTFYTIILCYNNMLYYVKTNYKICFNGYQIYFFKYNKLMLCSYSFL